MKRNNKIIVLLLVIIMMLPGFVQADTRKGAEVIRIAGSDRVETAIKVSSRAFKDGGAKTVVLAGYNGQADALIGTLLADEKDAPILLTYKDKLDRRLEKEIKRLGAEKVYILGGETVVQAGVSDALGDLGLEVKRLKGKTRVETAVSIVDEVFGTAKPSGAFVVEYNALADALAIGPVAALEGKPLYITGKNTVPAETEAALKSREIKDITIIGGENVVTAAGKTALETVTGKTSDRISGSNRSKTALNIAEKFYAAPKAIVTANGYGNYADALVGGYFAKREGAPILLTNRDKIESDVLSFIEKTDKTTYVLGGESSVSGLVFDKIISTLKADSSENEAVKELHTLIDQLPETDKVTLEDEAAILAAIVKYESLTQAERDLLKNEEKLIEVFAKLEVLKLKEDVEEAISALPSLKNLRLDDKAKVTAARELADKLIRLDPSVLIEGIKDLEAAEARLEELK